jgi:hypothetical protein
MKDKEERDLIAIPKAIRRELNQNLPVFAMSKYCTVEIKILKQLESDKSQKGMLSQSSSLDLPKLESLGFSCCQIERMTYSELRDLLSWAATNYHPD